MTRIKIRVLAPIVVAAFVVGIGGTAAFNLWKTETTKEPVKYLSGEFAGQANPADIRGSYTFADITAAFGVPVADLARAFGYEAEKDPGAVQVKSLEAKYADISADRQIGTDSVRLFVALYKGLPMTPQESTGLPSAAVEILLAKAPLDKEKIADLRAREAGAAAAPAAKAAEPAPSAPAVAPPVKPPANETAAEPPAAPPVAPADATTHTESPTDRTVKGSTTIANLLDWGVAQADIEKVVGAKVTTPGVTLKDFCAAQGIEFSAVKTNIQALVDAKK
jgi:hypothetical protein